MTLAVETTGHGPDLALLHGWGLGRGVWQDVAEDLAQHCRVHRVSLPGYDGSPEIGTDNGTNFQVTALALTDALPAGTTLCGWSLGGMLAMAAVAQAPRHFSRLALVGSTPAFLQHDGWTTAQPPSLLDGFAAAVATDAAKTLTRFVMLFAQGDAAARQVARTLTPLLAEALPSSDVLLRGLGWLRDVDLRDTLPVLALPTLIVHGERDPLMPFAAAQAMAAALPQARLEGFAGTAHAPFVSDPTRFAALLAGFCHDPA